MEDEAKDIEVFESQPIVPLELRHKTIEEVKREEAFKRAFIEDVLTKGEYSTGADYGTVPGVKTPMAFKEAIQLIMSTWHLGTGNPIIEKEKEKITVDGKDMMHYTITVKIPIVNILNNQIVGVGMGSCSTMESKYRYRSEERKCPKCKNNTIIKGRSDYGGGWLCFVKKGGCGEKFHDDDPLILDQEFGKIENENPHDVLHTVILMAKKRAKGNEVLDITGMSKYIRIPEIEDNGHVHEASSEEEQKRKEAQKEKYSKPPPEKEDIRTEKEKARPTKEQWEKLETEVIKLVGSADLAEQWLSEKTKHFRELTSFSEISTVKWLGNLKGSLKKDIEESKKMKQKDLIPEAPYE
jgi:hypothetical protein